MLVTYICFVSLITFPVLTLPDGIIVGTWLGSYFSCDSWHGPLVVTHHQMVIKTIRLILVQMRFKSNSSLITANQFPNVLGLRPNRSLPRPIKVNNFVRYIRTTPVL